MYYFHDTSSPTQSLPAEATILRRTGTDYIVTAYVNIRGTQPYLVDRYVATHVMLLEEAKEPSCTATTHLITIAAFRNTFDL